MTDGQFSECWKGSVSLTLAVCSVCWCIFLEKKVIFMLHPSVLDDSYKIEALRINKKKTGSQKTTQNAENTKKYLSSSVCPCVFSISKLLTVQQG